MIKKKFRNICLVSVLGIAHLPASVLTMPVQVQTYISSMFLMIRQENFTSPIMRFLRNTGKKKQDRMLM